MHHKGHGHGFPLVWLYEKVRWGHHEMAVRPSHRPHRDQSPCITLKMAQARVPLGPPSPEPGGSREPPWPRLVPLWLQRPLSSVQKRTEEQSGLQSLSYVVWSETFLKRRRGNSCALVALFHWKLLFPIFSYSMCLKSWCCSVAFCENGSGLLWYFSPPPKNCIQASCVSAGRADWLSIVRFVRIPVSSYTCPSVLEQDIEPQTAAKLM